MFRDLDDTLTQILNDAGAPPELVAADVSFELPDKNFTPAQSTVNLFLYDVHENRELRDPVPIMEKVGNMYVNRRPPLRVDCMYMVTAWSVGTGPSRIANEHRLLSQSLLWLSRFPTIPSVYLQGGLVNPPFPHPTLVAQLNGKQGTGDFWTALGQPPRPSFNLLVTIAMDLSVQSPVGPPVVTKDMRLLEIDKPATQEQWFQIGGTVFEAANPANVLGGAQVRLVERDDTVTTNPLGQFTFSQLTGGNYTLQVSMTGFANQTKAIVVPGTIITEYDVGMTP
jgi:Pvc16 N-terminal domain/Carboxypeptidase regulatory-like domain